MGKNKPQTLEHLTKRYRDLEERKIRNHAVLGGNSETVRRFVE